MADQKKPKRPRGDIPAKGRKCEKTIRPASRFHKGSFRWTFEQNRGKGAAAVLVGCPIETRTKSMGKGEKRRTRWNPKAKPGEQCQFVYGGKAGLLGHKVLQTRAPGGSCRAGYERL